MKRTAQIAVALVVLAAAWTARATTFGYVDTSRVDATATEPKRLVAEIQQDQQDKAEQVNKAAETAKQAKGGAQQAAEWKRFNDLHANLEAQLRQHQVSVRKSYQAHLQEVLVKLKTSKHVDEIIVGQGASVFPGVDLTDDAIKQWDALDIAATAAENERLKAEVATLRAAQQQKAREKK